LIDSAGLELLVQTNQRCISRGGGMQLAAASTLIRDVLRITGLDHEMSLHRDVVLAAGVFAR
jgi:anti-anti-sigma factor